MAKKSKKRRAWTATEIRELKSLAQKEDRRGKDCQEVEKDGRRHAPKGVQHRALARFPFLIFLSIKRDHGSAPACRTQAAPMRARGSQACCRRRLHAAGEQCASLKSVARVSVSRVAGR